MAQILEVLPPAKDPRAVEILAKNIYREFRAGGFSERDVLALAGELLTLVTRDVRGEARGDR
ncbi:MAG TPA: hypothetical protein VER33_16020 [Polyangiaceae bacterium]|nr:hypothetical protein [Polyangiaceae bacterium]